MRGKQCPRVVRKGTGGVAGRAVGLRRPLTRSTPVYGRPPMRKAGTRGIGSDQVILLTRLLMTGPGVPGLGSAGGAGQGTDLDGCGRA